MPYPNSPFCDNFDTKLITKNYDTGNFAVFQNENDVMMLLEWLCTTPHTTSFRVNTMKTESEAALKIIKQHLDTLVLKSSNMLEVYMHPVVRDAIIIKHFSNNVMQTYIQEVVVDVTCAAAVLRGAHIYAPGVIGMLATARVNDIVSVYADISRNCKKGYQKIYNDPRKLLIGNGKLKVNRYDLFGKITINNGVAVEMLETISGCPPIGDKFAPPGHLLLQNLPSILCVNVLDPRPGETILDMCAAPGNKTTHIATLMNNEGILIAIDKTPAKIKMLEERCKEFEANALIFKYDSTKLLDNSVKGKALENGPPFPNQQFDKILLDAPCSVLGKRPQLCNIISEREIKSHVPLQKRLLRNAVELLKPGGKLVYSTCTVTLAENEGIVEWILLKFQCMKLVKAEPYCGSPGWPGTSLSKEDLSCVQRFGPNDETDSVGFFIAEFKKYI